MNDQRIAEGSIVVCIVFVVFALIVGIGDCAVKQACFDDDGMIEQFDCYSVPACKDCTPQRFCDWRCIR